MMQFQLSPAIANEIKQEQAISDRLVKKILLSKRLLVDHVESLEQCFTNMPSTATTDSYRELFTARNTCLLVASTALEHFITPKSLRLTLLPSVLLSTGFSAIYVIKNIFVCRNKIVERGLDKLIRNIDEFGNCIRRNMTYFNELTIMKQQDLIDPRQIEHAWDCITAAKEVTEILYDATRKLENVFSLPPKFLEFYSPMEELRDSEYFQNNVTDYSPKQIKDFYNIFAYVQSQFLLRLALTISTKPSLSKLSAELAKIDDLIHQLVQQEENHFKNLTIELNKKKQIEVDKLNAAKAMQNRSGPIAVLQDSSLKLSALMVAVAGECQALDITLQRLTATEADKLDNSKELLHVAHNMRNIENSLTVCFDDFQRLALVYSKFLSSKLDEKDNKSKTKVTTEFDEEFPESFLRVEISENQNDNEKSDDFYAYLYDEQQAKSELAQQMIQSPVHDLEILNFEKRITKGKFRPVLKQLKDRIDPIRQVMLEKERKVLTAKGINVDELFNKTTDEDEEEEEEDNNQSHKQPKYVDSDSDEEGSADLEFEKRSKKLKERDNFAEMRNFLAQKEAINFFNAAELASPVSATGDEEIIESEC